MVLVHGPPSIVQGVWSVAWTGFTFWTAGECEEGGIWILNEKKLRSVSFSFFTHTTNGRAWAKRWRERRAPGAQDVHALALNV